MPMPQPETKKVKNVLDGPALKDAVKHRRRNVRQHMRLVHPARLVVHRRHLLQQKPVCQRLPPLRDRQKLKLRHPNAQPKAILVVPPLLSAVVVVVTAFLLFPKKVSLFAFTFHAVIFPFLRQPVKVCRTNGAAGGRPFHSNNGK